MLDRFFIHQINALSFVAEKRHGLCKSYSKKEKEKKKKVEKNGQMSEICKTMETHMPT